MSDNAAQSRVLIVDDHPIIRHGIAQLVDREPDFGPCGEAEGADDALAQLGSGDYALATIDLSLDAASGLDVVRLMRDRFPTVRMLVVSMHDERLHAERALRAGASGYVMKQEATKKIVTALRAIRAGRVWLSETMGSLLLQRLAVAGAPMNAEAKASRVSGLSERELEVMRLVARGLKTGEIARALSRSVHTIDSHRSNIKRKLGLRSSSELAKAAFELAGEIGTQPR